MPGTAVNRGKTTFASGGGGGSTTALDARVTVLEDGINKITYFFSIPSGTSGAVTIPTGATILLDQLYSGADAFVDTIANGQPTGLPPFTAGGVEVDVTSFDALGNYVISGTPSAYPIALIYQLTIKEKDKGNLTTANILDMEDIKSMPYLTGTAGKYLRFNGLGTDPIASTLILPNTGTANCVPYYTSTNNLGQNTGFTFDGTVLNIITLSGSQAIPNRIDLGDSYSASISNTTLKLYIYGRQGGNPNDFSGIGYTASSEFTFHAYGQGVGSYIWCFDNAGFAKLNQVGLFIGGATTPTARIHLGDETASASTEPIRFTVPAAQTSSPVSQALGPSTTGDVLTFVIATGAARKNLIMDDGTLLTTARVPSASTNGRLVDYSSHTYDGTNFAILGTGSFGSGTKVMFMGDASAVPSTNPTAGVIFYSESGIAKYRDVSGNVVTI